MAADHFRQALLLSKEDERNLKVKLDMAEDEVDREGQIITFYKTPNIDWARPFQAKLQGDVAMGDGVARHFLSLVIHKLKHGFTIDVDFIQWPQEDDGEEPKKIKEFLLRFISTVSQDKLKQLVKFWVGWEIPMTNMKVEVVDNNNYPRASTCFRTLRVPSHYQTYDDFSESLEMCLGTSEFGFGLI
ncbi:unnamed protein product [Merluccius merluccius]